MSAAPVPTPTPPKTDSKAEKETVPAGLEDAKLVLSDTSITLNTKDGKSFVVDNRNWALNSNLIKTGLENDKDAKEYPVPGVTSEVMRCIIDYMVHHKGADPPIIEKPLRSKVMADVCTDKWDATFIDKIGENRQLLYDLILAANYMDMKVLLHLGCAKVASLIKGQPLEKIKEILDPKQNTGTAPATGTPAATPIAAPANAAAPSNGGKTGKVSS